MAVTIKLNESNTDELFRRLRQYAVGYPDPDPTDATHRAVAALGRASETKDPIVIRELPALASLRQVLEEWCEQDADPEVRALLAELER